MFEQIESLERRVLLSVSIKGNSVIIAPDDTTPSRGDFTDYGPIGVAQGQVTRTYKIVNSGPAAITITSVVFGGTNPGDFTVLVAPAPSLAAGANTKFTVQFDPSAAGTRTATLRVTTTDATTPLYRFSIQGTGLETTTQSDGLQFATTVPGTGPGAATRDKLTVNYTLYLLDGSRLESSLDVGSSPFDVTLGVSNVITGWTEGLAGMKAGESRVLIIPPALGYSSTGSGKVPPNATILFEISALSLQPSIAMSGNGQTIASGDTTPRALDNTDFGFVAPGGPVTKTFVLASTDLTQLHVADYTHPFALSGPGAASFSVGTYQVTGNNVQFPITYTPSTAGIDRATVSFVSDDPNTPNYTFAIVGQMLSNGITFVSGALVVTGTAANDTVALTRTDDQILVTDNGVANQFPLSGIRSITISTLAGDDLITVGSGVPAIAAYGGDGNDTIIGGDGNDTLQGNAGDDSLVGGPGNDVLQGGLGADTLNGLGGNDSIYGGDGADSISGGAGDDYIEGRGKADTTYGGDGNDTIYGGAGADLIYGGAGDDYIDVGPSPLFHDSVYAGLGNDTVRSDAEDLVQGAESLLA